MKKFILLILFIPSFVFANDLGVEIFVKNTEETINIIDDIYQNREINDYYLFYDEGTVDEELIKKHYQENYYSDNSLNTYTYSQYGIIYPSKFVPLLGENVITVSNRNRVITKEEEKKLEDFSKSFLKQFEGKTDYEKIYMAYKYISENAVYQNEGSFANFIDGYLSAYDVLIEHKAVCIGSSTAFSYLMDKLGIESYIVDHVGAIDVEKSIYYTSHTFNVVKLDNKYYIVDIKYNGDLSGLLIGNKNYQNESYNYDIVISDEDYQRPDFTYNFNEEIVESVIVKKGNESIYFIVLFLILAVIFLIIMLVVKKFKN